MMQEREKTQLLCVLYAQKYKKMQAREKKKIAIMQSKSDAPNFSLFTE